MWHVSAGGSVGQTQPTMTQIELELELAALRTRRYPRLTVWLRSMRPFDRRSIREPSERDAYWDRVQRRLAESDYESQTRFRASEPASAVVLALR